MSNLEDARLAYEVARGSRCSDNHWYNTRRLLARHGLEVNTENVQFFAELRQSIPRSAIGIEGLLDCYKKADEILSKSTQSLKGYRVLEILRQYGVSPHQSTISRWFQPLGGYRRNREYPPQKLKSLFSTAFIYKAQHSTKLPEAI